MRIFHAIISILSSRFPLPSDTGGGKTRERAALLELLSNRRGETGKCIFARRAIRFLYDSVESDNVQRLVLASRRYGYRGRIC